MSLKGQGGEEPLRIISVERVSVDSQGNEGNGGSSGLLSISADGRFVAFTSRASNLVAGDNNGVGDVFVHDRQTGQTTRVSISFNGEEGNGESGLSSISADGSFVAFESLASNLVAGDNNRSRDIFVVQLRLPQPRIGGRLDNQAIGNLGLDFPSPPPAPKSRCTDSDGGANATKFGITTRYSSGLFGLEFPFHYMDTCCVKSKQSYLEEFFCAENQVQHQWFQCSCQNGKCGGGPIQRLEERQVPQECKRN